MFGAARNVVEKAPGDWVSDTDTASQRAVREELLHALPRHPRRRGGGGRRHGRVGWLVDPLDGTANFVHGFPVVGVSIALVAEGVPIVAVVDVPLLGDTYTARSGGGAHRGGELLHVGTRSIEQAIVATGFPFRKKRERLDEYFPVFERALRTFEDLRRAGAAASTSPGRRRVCSTATSSRRWVRGTWLQAHCSSGRPGASSPTGAATTRAWLTSGDVVAGPPHVHEAVLQVIADAG